MKNLLLLLAVFMCLVGCESNNTNVSSMDLLNYRCSEEQVKLVKMEVAACSETSYFSSFCFEQAKKSQCDKIKSPPTPEEG